MHRVESAGSRGKTCAALSSVACSSIMGHMRSQLTKLRLYWHQLIRRNPSLASTQVGRFSVDPVLSVLEQLWRGLNSEDKSRLVDAARREPLFPVAIDGNTAKRISTQDATCFYPPRFLHGEVPLAGLSFLLQELCWGDLTPKERNIELQCQMEAWKALFDIREFKFPEVMRASVLPALDLERDTDEHSDRATLQDLDRLAAICQLAGRTPNANAPLPYERLGPNRALFNLSRLDVPCRGDSDGDVKWTPAYKAYFGSDWLGASSVECILEAGRDTGVSGLPAVDFVLGPIVSAACWNSTVTSRRSKRRGEPKGDVGEDEVSVDEDEEAALDADDRERWLRFFQWLGVNASLRAGSLSRRRGPSVRLAQDLRPSPT